MKGQRKMKIFKYLLPNITLFIIALIITICFSLEVININIMRNITIIFLILSILAATIIGQFNKIKIFNNKKHYVISIIIYIVILLLGLLPSILFLNKDSNIPVIFNLCFYTFTAIFIPLITINNIK